MGTVQLSVVSFASPLVTIRAVAPEMLTLRRRWVIRRDGPRGSRNVTTSPGRASAGAICRSTTMSPVSKAGCIEPDNTVKLRMPKAIGTAAASRTPAARPATR